MNEKAKQQDPLVIKAAIMRHHLGYSQRDIAERLNLSSMTVSRLLEKGRQTGVIEVVVHTPIQTVNEHEERIQKIFDVERVIVARNIYQEDASDFIARAAAFYVDLMIANGDILAISAGRTMRRVMPHLRLDFLARNGNLRVVQTMGGFANPGSYNPISVLQEFAARFGIKGYFFNLPVYAPSMEGHEALKTHAMDSAIKRKWQQCTITVTGVGPPGEQSIYRIEQMLCKEEMDQLIEMGAVGAIYGCWFDAQGNFLDTDVNQRVLGIPIELVRKIPKRVLISQGREKLEAIKGVLKTGLFNVFITDGQTARSILDRP